jgi:hypothetical protein
MGAAIYSLAALCLRAVTADELRVLMSRNEPRAARVRQSADESEVAAAGASARTPRRRLRSYPAPSARR